MTRRAVGQRIEGQVAKYLQRRGLQLIARNYACRFGEIDLVMRHDDILAFIEVRGRASTAFLAPAQRHRRPQTAPSGVDSRPLPAGASAIGEFSRQI